MIYEVLKRRAQVHRRNMQRIAVLGDSAASYHDALLAKNLGDLAVGKRPAAVLGGNQLLEQRADRGGLTCAARISGDVAAEEILQLEIPARRRHEFLRG